MTFTRSKNVVSAIIFMTFALTDVQGRAEESPDILKLRPSHRTVREKHIVVPHEVLLRWKAIKLAVIDKTRGTENIYTVPIGSPYTVPYAKLVIMVDAFLPAFTMEGMTITTSSNELLNPSAKVNISENGTYIFQGWLFTEFPNTHAVTHPRFGFSLIGVVPR